MSSHAPAPWKRDGYKNDAVSSVIIRDATGFEIANVRHWGIRETDASANLIAAAPEMLEALQQLVAVEDAGYKPGPNMIQQFRNIIAKATGEHAL